MAFSYPIWNKITACIYKSGKSYGVKKDGLTEILIGTSASNSHEFAKVRTTHRKNEDGTRTYHFYIDDQLYKTATLQGREIDIKIHELYIVGGVTEHKLDDEISIKHKLTN